MILRYIPSLRDFGRSGGVGLQENCEYLDLSSKALGSSDS